MQIANVKTDQGTIPVIVAPNARQTHFSVPITGQNPFGNVANLPANVPVGAPRPKNSRFTR